MGHFQALLFWSVSDVIPARLIQTGRVDTYFTYQTFDVIRHKRMIAGFGRRQPGYFDYILVNKGNSGIPWS